MRASLATIPRPKGISSDAACVSFSPSAFTFDTEPHNQLCNLASFDATLTPRTLIHTRMKCITSVSSVSVRSFVRNRGCRRQRRARLDADFLPLLSRRARAPARSGTQRGCDGRTGFDSRLRLGSLRGVVSRREPRGSARRGASSSGQKHSQGLQLVASAHSSSRARRLECSRLGNFQREEQQKRENAC